MVAGGGDGGDGGAASAVVDRLQRGAGEGAVGARRVSEGEGGDHHHGAGGAAAPSKEIGGTVAQHVAADRVGIHAAADRGRQIDSRGDDGLPIIIGWGTYAPIIDEPGSPGNDRAVAPQRQTVIPASGNGDHVAQPLGDSALARAIVTPSNDGAVAP